MAQPTAALQDAIEATHAAIADEQDPKHKAILGGCLTQMMKIQAEHMQSPEGGQQADQGQQMPPDQGLPQGGPDPRALLLAQLGGGGP